VLTWWQGLLVQGHGEGEAVIADSSYQVKHVIKGQNGVRADLHEFVITPQGTALISAYRTHSGVDLSAIGGPKSGYLYSGVVQEIDIATGTLLFEWESYDPASPAIALTETYLPLEPGQGTQAKPFDYLHLNSIVQDADGDLIISGRHTWAIYKISKSDGSITWRLNGKKSDFTMGPDAKFLWQHHVRSHAGGRLTVFDNADGPAAPKQQKSRALVLAYDTTSKHVSLVKGYAHPGAVVLAEAMGSAEILPGGDMFVDWGFATRFSQFSADGRLLLDGRMASGAPSYRGFSREWEGQPADRPAVAVRRSSAGVTVYASWNGATNVASWTVLAGATRTSLSRVGTAHRAGFETAIAVPKRARYYAVQAHDAAGQAMSMSRPAEIR
jgi:Arylsulfotransferase (ASST)